MTSYYNAFEIGNLIRENRTLEKNVLAYLCCKWRRQIAEEDKKQMRKAERNVESLLED
ncbi:hypothetical protein J4463_02495 [Candidatus Pacearchaeota archaeon]|nr:hypothetical protein [Candidatus Pacearchaeota archaeon]